jgi:hypothetical protein
MSAFGRHLQCAILAAALIATLPVQVARAWHRTETRVVGRSGQKFVTRALAEITARARRGERVCVVFDIDNTLADTRRRTLAAAAAFGRAHAGTAAGKALQRARLDQIGIDAVETCARLKIRDPEVIRAFDRFWLASFWKPGHFRLDTPIAAAVRLARQAKRAGAEVHYLTGRIEASRPSTLAELRRFKLPDADNEHLRCKPGLGARTALYKESVLRDMFSSGMHVAWFITEGRGDIAHLQRSVPQLSCLRLDFPLDLEHARIKPGTPVLACPLPAR